MDTGEGSIRDILNADGAGPGAEQAPPALPPAMSPGGVQNAPQGGKLWAGKFKTPEELEKGHAGAQKLLTQEQMKRAALEKLLGRPDLKKLAASDPQIKDALTKAGYTLAEEEQRQEEAEQVQQGDTWNGDENDIRYKFAALERKLELRDQRGELERELKRTLQPKEVEEIREVMRNVSPKMHVMQAWKLTPSFEKSMKELHAKELEKARGPVKTGFRPPPMLLPTGQKGENVKKRPSQESGIEKDDRIREIVRRST